MMRPASISLPSASTVPLGRPGEVVSTFSHGGVLASSVAPCVAPTEPGESDPVVGGPCSKPRFSIDSMSVEAREGTAVVDALTSDESELCIMGLAAPAGSIVARAGLAASAGLMGYELASDAGGAGSEKWPLTA